MVQPNPGAQLVSPLTGSEIVDLLGVEWGYTTTAAIAGLASLEGTNKKVTALNTAGAGTITAAGIIGGVVARGGSQSGTAFIDTTTTAAQIIAALPSGAPVGASWSFIYTNNTNAVATIAHGTNVTISSGITPTATVTIAANGYAAFLVTYVSGTSVTFVQTEAGAFAADSADTTKIIGYTLSGQTTATTALIATQNTANATYTLPVATTTLAGLGTAQTFSAAQSFSAAPFVAINTPVAATGSALSSAAQVLAGVTLVTASDGTKCVKLPATPVAGTQVTLLNSVAAEPLIIFPDAAATINAIGSHGAYTCANGVPLTLIATSTTQWYTLPLLGS